LWFWTLSLLVVAFSKSTEPVLDTVGQIKKLCFFRSRPLIMFVGLKFPKTTFRISYNVFLFQAFFVWCPLNSTHFILLPSCCVCYLQQMQAGGFALHCANIRELARQMLMMRVMRGFSMPYRDGCPGHNWLAGFLKRHPGNIISVGQRLLHNSIFSHQVLWLFVVTFYDWKSLQSVKVPCHHFPGVCFLGTCPDLG